VAWARVQFKTGHVESSSGALVVTPDSSVTVGSALLVVIGSYYGSLSSGLPFTVTDDKGNTYTQRRQTDDAGGTYGSLTIFEAHNVASGSTAVSVTAGANGHYYAVTVLEYSGLDATAPYDQSAGATPAGTTYSSGSVTTTQAEELLLGANHRQTATNDYAPDSGWSGVVFINGGGFHGLYVAERGVSSTGTYAYTGSSAGNSQAVIATFKTATGGAAGHPAMRRLGGVGGARPVEIGREGVRVFRAFPEDLGRWGRDNAVLLRALKA
jgi:hypothetical protein